MEQQNTEYAVQGNKKFSNILGSLCGLSVSNGQGNKHSVT